MIFWTILNTIANYILLTPNSNKQINLLIEVLFLSSMEHHCTNKVEDYLAFLIIFL